MIKILLVLIFIVGCATTSNSNNTLISGKTHQGEQVSFDIAKSPFTAFIFMSSRCPCSESHNEIIKKLSNEYKEIKFVGVHSNYNEKLKHADKYFNELNFDFPVIYDSESIIAKKYGAVKTPHVFIVNAKDTIIYSGSVTNSSNGRIAKTNYLDIALKDIRSGIDPQISQRTSLGCYIPIKE